MALFTVAEARAFNTGELKDAERYSDDAITDAEELINDWLYQNCGVRFEPTTETDVYRDGSGTRDLWVIHHRLIAVSACVVYAADGSAEETFDAADLSDLAIYPEGKIRRRQNGVFAAGDRNVKLTYSHGWASTPPAVKRAALIACLAKLIPSDVSSRVTSLIDGDLHMTMSVPGRGRTEWEGIPEVDTVIRTYNESIAGLVG